MIERRDVEFPLWRKKVDASLLKDGFTPIPKWLLDIWVIEKTFGHVKSKKDEDAYVGIQLQGKSFTGQVSKVKKPTGYQYRLYLQLELIEELRETFLMSYMKSLEAELSENSNNRAIDEKFSFWEFIDIEYDSENKTFHLTPHYKLQPYFPNLFSKLVGSAPVKSIGKELLDETKGRIEKQDWEERGNYKNEIGAENVIYMLIDTDSKLLYIGEAQNLKKRFDRGHPDIKDWNYYKYNVLPVSLADHRVTIERMLIRDMAALLPNKQNINNIAISEYRLANRKIDK